jgi:hypothetical protein
VVRNPRTLIRQPAGANSRIYQLKLPASVSKGSDRLLGTNQRLDQVDSKVTGSNQCLERGETWLDVSSICRDEKMPTLIGLTCRAKAAVRNAP